jgi:hypothetical protein
MQLNKEVVSSHASFSSGIGSSDITAVNSTVMRTYSPPMLRNMACNVTHYSQLRFPSKLGMGSTSNMSEAGDAPNTTKTDLGKNTDTNTSNSTSNTDTITSNSTSNTAKSSSSDSADYGTNLNAPFIHNEDLAKEVLSKAGPANTYQRKDHSHDIGSVTANTTSTIHSRDNLVTKGPNFYHDFTAKTTTEYKLKSGSYTNHDSECTNVIKIEDDPLSSESLNSNSINQDPDPIHIMKPNTQNVVYKQQVNIRYLQPPTPPPPAPIIIREKQLPTPPSQPPIIIRQTAPAPPTPVPLIIRERAPTPPTIGEPTIIEVWFEALFFFKNYNKSCLK